MSMEQKAINLKSLTMDELAGVVNLYPWYGAARKELCQRMAGMGGESWGVSQFSDQAMYVGDRGMIAEIMRQGKSDDYADKDLESLLGTYIDEKKREENSKAENEGRKVHVVGGDFFSQNDYEKVRRAEDNVFVPQPIKKKAGQESPEGGPGLDFCTETLAQIYAEQGYFEQARKIYAKLILAFPEKSAYFASLIKELDQLINNQSL